MQLLSMLLSHSFLLSGVQHSSSSSSLSSTSSSRFGVKVAAMAPLHLIEEQRAPLPQKADASHVRLVVLSDTHGRHSELPPLPDGDVLLHLGDVADRGNVDHIRSFVEWIEQKRYHRTFGEIVCIEGNHDRDRRDPQRIDLQKEYGNSRESSIICLQDEHYDLAQGRLRVYGASWDSCEQEDFRQMRARRSDSQFAQATTPPPDMLLTHVNPAIRGGGHGWKGSKEITRIVNRDQIPLHLFGHVHWGRGARVLQGDINSVMVNCASTWNEPVVVDWDPVAKQACMVHCPKPNLVATAGKLFTMGTENMALAN